MLSLPLLLALQGPTSYAVLQAEYARSEDVSVLVAGTKSDDKRVQRVAIRALGRQERPSLIGSVAPFTHAGDVALRLEAVAALAQMSAQFDFASLLAAEKDASVRAVIYEAIGRNKPLIAGSEAVLVTGLKDANVTARTGAARGLETWVRVNARAVKPSAGTLDALRQAVRENEVSELRQFALLALNSAGDQDPATFDIALEDADPQVRRVAVVGSKRWVEDPSPLVRLEAMRLAGTCERALAALDDASGHVVLAAVELLGTQKCTAAAIEPLVDKGASWRLRAQALVSLAKVAPDSARPRVALLARDPVWQVRAYAANAARLINDDASLAVLASDSDPNVAAAALTALPDALRALQSSHSGLLIAAATRLKGTTDVTRAAPQIVSAIQRLTSSGRSSLRDARVKLVELFGEAGQLKPLDALKPLLADRDPVVAMAVARAFTRVIGRTTEPVTKIYKPEPFPSESTLRSLEGASAVLTMEGVGTVTIELLPDEAPATVATFVQLAEKGAYNGLTIHRVVPNFVLQGGSPGADEFDPLTDHFMRDEVGLTSNGRGTFGISTRGHDTGDGQIYINLIDNWRLDHTYTVFAKTVAGLEVVDRILEGDVIASIRILRKR
ncbi:MAG: peptidylprolyl isomerase [Vicinamibacteria bacterium]